MKTTIVSRVVAAVTILTAAAGPALVAQGRDTLGRGRLMVAVVRAPTVIAIGDTTQAEGPLGSIRTVLDSLGFALQVFATPIRQVIDQGNHAVYYVSRDLTTGYVIITPGRRPVTVSGFLAPDSLRARVLTYLRLTRPLERDRS